MAKRPIATLDGNQSRDVAAKVLKHHARFDARTYQYDDRYQPWTKTQNALGIHSTPELLEALNDETLGAQIDIEARVICRESSKNSLGRSYGMRTLNKAQFLEAHKKNSNRKFLRESADLFSMDISSGGGPSGSGGLIGHDFVPMLGGPFNKQLYYYDYLRMHALAFQAYHHDPFGRAIVQITRDFTLGRGYRIDSDNKAALALWHAFEKVNNIHGLMESIALELSIYGEVMPWWLPNNATKIGYQLRPGQEVPRGILPRVRLIDPSVIWEIVTYPEDISRVLWYQWVAPTQYQLYSGQGVPTAKFIYQQIPADQVDHYKVNSVSNEKRGRSDLFPVLGDLKRLRDTVDYQIVGLQKNAAWSIDTTLDGSQADVDAYIAAMAELGTIPDAGSEFVHTSKVTRNYLHNSGGKGTASDTFDWVLSKIAAGSGIPISYFGTHMSGGQTRASALVATEPVAKKFQMRQIVYERIIKDMAHRLFKQFGITADIEVTFPELITQDRSAKLADLALSVSEGWLSKETAAEISAKEFGITEYDFQKEQEKIKADESSPTLGAAPLSAPGKAPPLLTPTPPKPGAITSQDRKEIATNARQ